MSFKMVLPCLAVLAASVGEARPSAFPNERRKFTKKANCY